MRTPSAVVLIAVLGIGLAGCTGSSKADGTATSTGRTEFGTPSTAEFSSAGSFVPQTQPTTTTTDDDVGPIIEVAGPTLDDFYPNLVGVFGPDDDSRCIWYSNADPSPVTIQRSEIRDQFPDEGFRLVPSEPPPGCSDYLTDIGAPVDVGGARYGDNCDGVTLPGLGDPSGSTPRSACALNIELTGAGDVDRTAALVLSLTMVCTDAALPPCDQLAAAPSTEEPVTVGWRQQVPLAACRASGSTQNWCGGDGPSPSVVTSATGTESTAGTG